MRTRDARDRNFPPWLVKRAQPCEAFDRTRSTLNELDLSTVCRSARCPNAGECFSSGTATFMILGETCTRNCAFCAVEYGAPAPPDRTEPERVAAAVERMNLSHAVVTSVTRDDLPDGGADQFARTIRAIRNRSGATVEVLIPDLEGSLEALAVILDAGPDVLNHNLETVRRLYPSVRPQADYDRSLELLSCALSTGGDVITKSGIMVGMSETRAELRQTFRDLAGVGCSMLTIGQYLPPTTSHFPIARYVEPEEFDRMRQEALGAGLEAVAAAPFVRSSYHAGEELEKLTATARATERLAGEGEMTMTTFEVTLPDLGADAGDEAQVSFWYFDVGERVEKDDDLVEMITDKAAFNVPSPVSGTLVELLVDEGDPAKVGEVICAIETDKED